ncbi:unnamed protein product [Soboliphyme baturini]|uniref:Secreted protein n=1 Tax=Soboliphyme baturini TaxID=241478 RepID=A0A183JB84_9BILA|nr:unnamed protein product [Soboliphyme baturini]
MLHFLVSRSLDSLRCTMVYFMCFSRNNISLRLSVALTVSEVVIDGSDPFDSFSLLICAAPLINIDHTCSIPFRHYEIVPRPLLVSYSNER